MLFKICNLRIWFSNSNQFWIYRTKILATDNENDHINYNKILTELFVKEMKELYMILQVWLLYRFKANIQSVQKEHHHPSFTSQNERQTRTPLETNVTFIGHLNTHFKDKSIMKDLFSFKNQQLYFKNIYDIWCLNIFLDLQ